MIGSHIRDVWYRAITLFGGAIAMLATGVSGTISNLVLLRNFLRRLCRWRITLPDEAGRPNPITANGRKFIAVKPLEDLEMPHRTNRTTFRCLALALLPVAALGSTIYGAFSNNPATDELFAYDSVPINVTIPAVPLSLEISNDVGPLTNSGCLPPSSPCITAASSFSDLSGGGIMSVLADTSTVGGADAAGLASVSGDIGWEEILTLTGPPGAISLNFVTPHVAVSAFDSQGSGMAHLDLTMSVVPVQGDSEAASGLGWTDYYTASGGGVTASDVGAHVTCPIPPRNASLSGLSIGCGVFSGTIGDTFMIIFDATFGSTSGAAGDSADLDLADTIYFNIDPETPGASYTTASGINYETGVFPPASESVPEPASLLVTAGALIFIGSYRFRSTARLAKIRSAMAFVIPS